MSTKFYFRKEIPIVEINSKTDLQFVIEEENRTFLTDGNFKIFCCEASEAVNAVIQYGGTNTEALTKVLKELITKLNLQVVSEFVLLEYVHKEEYITDEVWKAYIDSVINSKNSEN